MTQPTTSEKGPEGARQELETRCLEAMGEASPILAKVLSYFPEEAELFIQTQNHAANIEGKRGIWYMVIHKQNNSHGLLDKTIYDAGGHEYLSRHGFTGEHLSKSIRIIKELRGERSTTDNEPYPFTAIPTEIDKIITAYIAAHKGETEINPMLQKLIEVMEVSETDINLLRHYSEIAKRREAANLEINNLNRQILALKEKQKAQEDKFNAELEQAYPVQTSNETE